MLGGNPGDPDKATLTSSYIGNGCEGYSPSMYIPAKSELSGTEEIESRKEYFLKFNYVYQPDELVGVWWQFRSKLMTIEEAKKFCRES